MKQVETKNAAQVMASVEKMIATIESGKVRKYSIRQVCEELSIFDWWNENLSKTQLQDMRKFLEEAIKLGYAGYVCFKVGASGCSNGMWAYKAESTTGYSPEGESLYKSFSPDYNYWQWRDADNNWHPDDDALCSLKTAKQLEQAMGIEG